MKTWIVRFKGHWLGGVALTKALSPEDALTAVQGAMMLDGLSNFEGMEVEPLKLAQRETLILDNGDY